MVDVETLGKTAYEIGTLHPGPENALVDSLMAAVREGEVHAASVRAILESKATPYRLAPVAVAIGRALLGAPDLADEDRAGILNSLANQIANTGDRTDALPPIREAVAIRRRLAEANPPRFEPNL